MKNKDHITVSSEDRARVVFRDAMGNTVITPVRMARTSDIDGVLTVKGWIVNCIDCGGTITSITAVRPRCYDCERQWHRRRIPHCSGCNCGIEVQESCNY